MDTRTKEAIRYLGYGRHAVDDETLRLIRSSFQELDQAADFRIIYRIFDLNRKENESLEIGTMKVTSKSLNRSLKGCEQIVLLGGTLGTGTDLLLRRYTLTDMAKVVVLQACAAAMLEEELDIWQEARKEEWKEEGWYLRPRFSPGYGDFSICHQSEILRMLDASKSIGLTLTDAGMLTPTKSVTALIGRSRTDAACHRQGCEACEKADCQYRR